MADLFNQQISATYSGLLKTSSSGVLSASLSQISDGRGNTSPLYLSTDSIQFYGAYSFPSSDGSANQVLKTDGAGVLTWEDDANSGTVTSVALSVPTGLTVTGSPITTNGTIAIGGTLGVANGGTGATTLTGILVGNGTSAISVVSDGVVSGQVLSTNANGTYSFINAAVGDVTKTGTITANQIAVWNDSTDELRSDETVTIGTDHSITLYQPNSVPTDLDNYNIGGGNISTTTGASNTGFGKDNLDYLTSGYQNTAIGYRALRFSQSASGNTAIGYQSLENYANDLNNINSVAVGVLSGGRNTGGNNTFIGSNSGRGSNTPSNNTGVANSALGLSSLLDLTSGSYNTAIGSNALEDLTTGSRNITLGYSSGSEITTGSYNVIIGSNTGSTIATSSNNIIISDGDGTSRIQVDGGGVVGIGVTPSPQSGGALAGSVETNGILRVRGANGSYFTSGDGLELSKTSIYSYNRDTPSGYNTLSINDTITVEGAGNVGIGTTPSPQNLIAGSLDLNGGASVFGYDKRAYLASNVYYEAPGGWKVKEAGYGAFMLAGLTNGDFGFYTTTQGTSANATVTDSRSLHIASGGLATFSSGIKFGTGDTLDAYEEGTWTPSLLGTSGGAASYTSQEGSYIRIGKQVTVNFELIFTKGTLSGGTLRLNNFPYVLNSTSARPVSALLFDNLLTTLYNPLLQGAKGTYLADLIGDNGATSGHSGLSINTYLSTGSMTMRGTLTYETN